MYRILFHTIICFSIFLSFSTAQTNKIKTYLVPFSSIGIDTTSTKSINKILSNELQSVDIFELIEENKRLTMFDCFDVVCATQIGTQVKADQVILGSMSKLGSKVVIQYLLIDVLNGKKVLDELVTSSSIEDLQVVMKRIAVSIKNRGPFGESVEVGTVTSEEAKITNTRKGTLYKGLSFGYLYPQNGYDNSERSFTMDAKMGYDLEDYVIGGQMAIRYGFAMNIFSSYMFSRGDHSPYIGGAFGFHFVGHEIDVEYDSDFNRIENKKREDGFELILHTGFTGFRTYNFHVNTQLDYSITFNDFDDKAIVFTLGLQWD